MKLSFKKHKKETGLSGIGRPYTNIEIKVNGDAVGIIIAPTWPATNGKWKVGFSVKKDEPDDNPNCDWKWIYLKEQFESEEDAREAVKNNIDYLLMNYTLIDIW